MEGDNPEYCLYEMKMAQAVLIVVFKLYEHNNRGGGSSTTMVLKCIDKVILLLEILQLVGCHRNYFDALKFKLVMFGYDRNFLVCTEV